MKHLILILIVAFFSCKRADKSELKEENVAVKLQFVENNVVCISVKNNTRDKIFIPDLSILGVGLKIYELEKNNRFIDITGDALKLSSSGFIKYSYSLLKKKYKINSDTIYLREHEKDSISSVIVKMMKNKDKHVLEAIKSNSFAFLKDMVFLNPGDSYTDFFLIDDSFAKMDLAIFFHYPYPYPVIQSGRFALNKETILFFQKSRDSLKFSYPQIIKGYKLYNKPFYSKPIIIKR